MNPTMYFNYALQMMRQVNPVLEIWTRIQSIAQVLMTYNSSVKLNKFRHNLYMQQLYRMESFISQGSPYNVRGTKMDRRF